VSHPAEQALVVEGLVKTYPASGRAPAVEAVRGLGVSVARGELFGLLGPNGAGKSTTLGCITTLVRPTAGRIVVDGIDVARDPAAAKRRLAVVPQARNLDRDVSVREVLTYHGRYFGLPAAEREARAERLLARMQLADKADARPLSLSGGMQQRLLIARALMHDPAVLLLDEPTTGLDPQVRRAIWDLLLELNREGLTILLTTHYMEEADRLCRRVAIVDHGRIVTVDTPNALKASLPGGRILDVWARGPEPVRPRLSRLEDVRRAEGLGDRGDDLERVRLYVGETDAVLDRVLVALREGGAELHHVSLGPPSLEDVYVHLTGSGLRE
jgi:ABC-2 type transport system ATP-binding protein